MQAEAGKMRAVQAADVCKQQLLPLLYTAHHVEHQLTTPDSATACVNLQSMYLLQQQLLHWRYLQSSASCCCTRSLRWEAKLAQQQQNQQAGLLRREARASLTSRCF